MSPIDDYLATVTPEQKAIFSRIRSIALSVLPSAEEGISYRMPALMYKGRAFLSLLANKKFLSLYPFSGKTIEKLRTELKDFECTSGSIHFSEEKPLPDELVEKIVRVRVQEIDEQLSKK